MSRKIEMRNQQKKKGGGGGGVMFNQQLKLRNTKHEVMQ